MHLLLVQLELQIPHAYSLKEKRSILKPLLHRLRRDYNVSISEMDHHDVWHTAGLAFSAVAKDKITLERLERSLQDELDTDPDVMVSAWEKEWL